MISMYMRLWIYLLAMKFRIPFWFLMVQKITF